LDAALAGDEPDDESDEPDEPDDAAVEPDPEPDDPDDVDASDEPAFLSAPDADVAASEPAEPPPVDGEEPERLSVR
jgi:hypothetical protein